MQPNNIRAIRTARNLTLEQLAEIVRVSAGQVSRWETKDVDIPTSRLAALANALGCTIDALLSDRGIPRDLALGLDGGGPPANNEDGQSGSSPKDDLQTGIREAYAARYQIPIYSTVDQSAVEIEGKSYEGVVVDRSRPFSYLYRTQRLSKLASTFGFYSKGHAMEPVYRDGDFILVSDMFPARIGDDVLVSLRPANDREAMQPKRAGLLRRLTRRTQDFVELEQFTPALTFRIPADRIALIHRVLKLDDALPVYVP